VTVTPVVNPNARNFYVTITGTQAGYFDACVGKRLIGHSVVWTRQTYYMDATYNYVWTSTVVQVDLNTETFHLEGICTDQSVHIVVYKDNVVRAQWNQPANNVFAFNE
jgi:hypothetical protein